MNLVELQRALRQLRCSGMAAGLEPRLLEAQTAKLAPIDFLSTLVGDELLRRQDRLLARRVQQAGFRDQGKTLDTFDFDFNKKMNRRLVFELATGHFVAHHADGLLLGPPGTGKSHLAQAIGFAVIQQGHRVYYREAHVLLDELADAQLAGTRKDYLRHVTTVPHLVIDDLGMKRLPHTAAEDLLEIVMRRYERASTLITSNRPVEDWGKLLGDTAAVTALLDRLLHHAHVLTCGPRSWRTRLHGSEPNPSCGVHRSPPRAVEPPGATISRRAISRHPPGRRRSARHRPSQPCILTTDWSRTLVLGVLPTGRV